MTKVYIVIGSDSPQYGDETWVAEVFSEEKLAEKYAEVHNVLDKEMYSYYVLEKNVKTDYDMNTTIKEYYSYYVSKEDDYDFDQGILFEYYEIKQWLIKNNYISEKELEKVEKNDKTLTDYGTSAHLDTAYFIKHNINEDIMKKLIEFINSPEVRWCNDLEPEKRIYDKDLVLEETDEYIQVYSVDSFEIARSEALRLYENWKTNRSNSI